MRLEKWYCDVLDNGVIQVHYLATLYLGKTSISYSGIMTSEGVKQSTFMLGSIKLPSLKNNQLFWHIGDEELIFTSKSKPISGIALWQTAKENLSWQPLMLNANVCGPLFSTNARGYAEVLSLDFGPWKLGLKTLIWGRFCSQQTSLVWIIWEGKQPMHLALLDGNRVQLRSANEMRVDVEGAHLEMTHPQVLIQDRLDHGSLKDFPLRGPLSKLEFLRGYEEKWHSPAILNTPQGVEHGYAVYERVTWN